MEPIGIFSSEFKEKYHAACQPGISQDATGVIQLNKGSLFEQALDDLVGFERIWVIFCFDRNHRWKPKVQPPRGVVKRGVFSTRSPHRPNSIGLSCVRLLGVDGLKIYIGSHDLLDQTPILDIKPYLPYADAFPDAKAGWVDEVEKHQKYLISWTNQAENQKKIILEKGGPDLSFSVINRLESSPYPHPSHRIKELETGKYELAFKSWRIRYKINGNRILVEEIVSGYRSLKGIDRYGDFSIHQAFILKDG